VHDETTAIRRLGALVLLAVLIAGALALSADPLQRDGAHVAGRHMIVASQAMRGR
jgi:hypothetical protein